MIVDRAYCMSSYLMFRTIADENCCFAEGVVPKLAAMPQNLIPIRDSRALEAALRQGVETALGNGRAALALSGGIDSAILAKFMPKGSTAYTFRCVVPGIQVTDESPAAARYAEECGLRHEVVDIYWQDFEEYLPTLARHKGAPFHSIEVQIYKAALRAKKDGFDSLIFGESADLNYGGLSQLLSRDWRIGEFIERYSYVLPWRVLREPRLVLEPYRAIERDGFVDTQAFFTTTFLREALGSYTNACAAADCGCEMPYARTILDAPFDYARIRAGENKYLVREVFNRLYPDFVAPPKLPMPRATNEWLKDWQGPAREEFYPHCAEGMSGDQKWLVYCLEQFLNLL